MRVEMKSSKFVYSVGWNLFLITLGAFIWVLGAKGAVLPHQLITGGLFGVSLLIYYHTHWLSPGIWFFLLRILSILLKQVSNWAKFNTLKFLLKDH